MTASTQLTRWYVDLFVAAAAARVLFSEAMVTELRPIADFQEVIFAV
jgi:hypothetical protein